MDAERPTVFRLAATASLVGLAGLAAFVVHTLVPDGGRVAWLFDYPVYYGLVVLAVGIRFRAGSRIRLDVTSSDFPVFDRNHNTGRPFHSDPELCIARQRVFHDAEHPSRLVLPVVPIEDGRRGSRP